MHHVALRSVHTRRHVAATCHKCRCNTSLRQTTPCEQVGRQVAATARCDASCVKDFGRGGMLNSFIIQYGGGAITANVKEKEAFSYVNDDVR